MRLVKALLVVFMVLGLAIPVFANISLEPLVNQLYNSSSNTLRVEEKDFSGSIITHRSGISDDDRLNGLPYSGGNNITIGLGADLTGFQKAVVHVKLSRDSGCIITPMFGNATADRYFSGDDEQVTGDSAFLIDVNGSGDFFVSIRDVSNPNGTLIDVFVIPTN